ncbi:conserved hypothetical protein [uncultured Mycobacterium sp.]|uniref:Uncharacterized protein n=1 Tax=uncultured Mycobacterium sp. TaxID=171292 RepID=A0A1Y5P9X3_9MYCO|nr:conserved hypothetical protein [uncultured Mycobacterium sp.]
MTRNFVFTDDEAVALAAVKSQLWPTGLTTVPRTPEAMRDAGMRGIRSLLVRGLVSVEPGMDGGYVVDPEFESAVSGFLGAAKRIGAYLAPAAKPDQLAGASITAARTDLQWWLVSATAKGVHSIRPSGRLEIVDSLAELAEKTYDGTLLAGTTDPASYCCVIRFGAGDDDKIVVSGNGAATGPRWSRTRLVEAFAGAVS